MVCLYIVRHAKSSWKTDGLDDFHRPINGRGRKAAPAMGHYMQQHGIQPDLILCSAAIRARETLELILTALDVEPRIEIEEDLYLASAGTLLERLRRLGDGPDSVMLIGHNPGLHDLALSLAAPGGEQVPAEKYPTAALTELNFEGQSWADISPHTGNLLRFVTPRSLA